MFFKKIRKNRLRHRKLKKEFLERLRTIFPLGKEFKYLDIKMKVTGYSKTIGIEAPITVTCLCGDYVDKNGKLQNFEFGGNELLRLINENEHEEQTNGT